MIATFRARPLSARGAATRAPVGLVLASLAVAVACLLPVAYLTLRALGAESDVLDSLLRPRTATILAGTVLLAVVVGVADLALGVPLAWLTTRTDLPGRGIWSVLTVVPLAIPSYVTAFAFVAAFGPRGALQDFLEPLGLERLPSLYGFPAAAIVLTLATYPYVMLAMRVALLRSDPALEEAARSLGDGPGRVFRRVTLPLLAPAIVGGLLLAVLYALSDFGAVAIVQFDSFARAIHLQYRASFDRQLAALFALVLAAATLLVAWAEARFRRRSARGRITAAGRPAVPVPLGAWRWPALALCTAVVSIALVLPAGTIVYWLVRGFSQGERVALLVEPAIGSLSAGISAAAVATLACLPVAILSARFPGVVSGLAERGVSIAYALPGIVLALSVVFFGTNLVPALYQTFALLVLAYAVRFVAQPVATTRSALQRVRPELVEAARGLGRGPLSAFLSVTVPLVRPGIVAGAALVFLTTVKELPLTLLLAPIGFETLATRVWSAVGEGFYARAAAPAGLLMVLSAATVAAFLRAEDRHP